MAQTRQELRRKNKADSRRLWRRRALVLLVLIILLVVGLVFFLRLDRWQIKGVLVRGNKVLSAGELSQPVERVLMGDYWYVLPRRQRWFYPAAASQAALLARFPRLSSALTYVKDGELVVQVKEHSPSAMWCIPLTDLEQCYFVNNQAIAFSPAPQFSRPIYLTIEFEAAVLAVPSSAPFSADALAKLLTFQWEFQELFDNHWSEAVNIFRVSHGTDSDYDFWVEPSAGGPKFRVIVNLDSELAVTLATLETVLSAGALKAETNSQPLSPEYLDLRFAPKVFYRIIK